MLYQPTRMQVWAPHKQQPLTELLPQRVLIKARQARPLVLALVRHQRKMRRLPRLQQRYEAIGRVPTPTKTSLRCPAAFRSDLDGQHNTSKPGKCRACTGVSLFPM